MKSVLTSENNIHFDITSKWATRATALMRMMFDQQKLVLFSETNFASEHILMV